jgi:hypothetical protein
MNTTCIQQSYYYCILHHVPSGWYHGVQHPVHYVVPHAMVLYTAHCRAAAHARRMEYRISIIYLLYMSQIVL